MKVNFTLPSCLYRGLIALLSLLMYNSAVQAQSQFSCNGERVLWLETFGTGTTSTSSPDVLTSGLAYQENGPLVDEGVYRVIDNTKQKPEWHLSSDHTGDVIGKMLVLNGQAETFFQHTITNSTGFLEGNYTVSLYVMNVDSLGVCGSEALLTKLTFTVEYLSSSNTWVPLTGSPFTAVAVPQTEAPVWVNQGASFTLPSTGNFIPTQIRITLGDGTVGGCGNDFAMDDVKFSYCAEGGPMPVELTSFAAHNKGTGVSLDWSTSQEINNSYFQVEKSINGTDWTILAKVNGAGNSQTVKNYNAFDANPTSGINYYRLKQVDFDGNFKYSRTVTIKADGPKTAISILTNPFHGTLSVNFNSASSQMGSARLMDITGKQVISESWSVPGGIVKKDFSTGSIPQGMYILTIRNNSGEILYNGKVVKQ
ncbi:MAG: T9SS type A sorting domain-containing protein [Ginsengibacter sp.]